MTIDINIGKYVPMSNTSANTLETLRRHISFILNIHILKYINIKHIFVCYLAHYVQSAIKIKCDIIHTISQL